MRKSGWGGAVLMTLLACSSDHPVLDPAVPPDLAAPDTTTQPEAIGATTQRWFVELDGPPLRRGGTKSALNAGVAQFRERAAAQRIRFTERRAFQRLWNGLSVEASPRDARRLLGVRGVKALYPVEEIQPPAPLTPAETPNDASSLPLIGADIAQNELGFTGQGVRVAIIDTGIDWHHPDLGGCFGPGCRVAFGWDLVGDAFAGPSSQPVPDNDPDDCGGHGTHVAGIVGAGGGVTGVAPDVIFGAYRVFGCAGSTTADIMLEAMERADADGMRVINMSIGSVFQWPTYPTAAAAQTLVDNGIVVVASAGNSGPSGLYASGAPSTGAAAIGVASIDNLMSTQIALRVTPDDRLIGYARATGAPLAPLSGSAPLARTGTITTPDDACEELPAGSLDGSIALVRRGTCSFYIKAKNAENAGAVGVVLYNNQAGAVTPTVAGTPPVEIPVVAVSQVDGEAINALLDDGAVTMMWTAESVSTPIANGGRISGFSSWGPAADLSLKPDVTGPGGAIWSTYPLERGGYASLGGTSMSAPHVAGAAALLLQARPEVQAAQVADLLRNTATPLLTATELLEPTIRQGAGLIQVDHAILSTAVITPSKLALGENETGAGMTRSLQIRNVSAQTVTWELSHTAAATVIGASSWTPELTTAASAAATFSPSEVTLGPGETATVSVTITPDEAMALGSYFTGWVVATEQGGAAALRVPYLGYRGDYQAIPVLTPTASDYPWLARRSGTTYTPQADGAEFTLAGEDMPWLVLHLDHFVSRLRVTVADHRGKPWGVMAEYTNVAHASSPTSFIGLGWDGMVTVAKDRVLVPNGSYRLRVEVLRALGDEATPSHWETWTSPLVVINHP